jgi:phospholipase/carboxylesterase
MPDPHRDQPVLASGRPLDSATAVAILIHGRGASAEDILGLAKKLHHTDLAYLVPEAAGHSWYPHSFLAPIEQNEPWLTSALGVLGRLVEDVAQAGIPRQKLILAGFSQGACLAAEFVARNAARYGALICFTGGLVGPLGTKFRYEGDLAGTPAFLGAGDPDPHVPWSRVGESARVLADLGADVRLRRYPNMPHVINQDEIEEARHLVLGVMAKELPAST